MKNFDYIAIVIYLIIIAISIVYILVKKIYTDKSLRFFSVILFLTFFVELCGFYNLKYSKSVPSIVFSLFLPFHCWFFALYFLSIIHGRFNKYTIRFFWILTLVFHLLNEFNFLKLNFPKFFSIVVLSIYYSIFSILYLYQSFRRYDENPSDSPSFWICTGTLFFYSSSAFIMLFIDMIYQENSEIATKLWFLIRVFNIILYLFYLYGLLCQVKRQNMLS